MKLKDARRLCAALIGWCGFLVALLPLGCRSVPVSINPEVPMLWKSYSLGSEIFTPTGSSMLVTREGYTQERFRMLEGIQSPVSRPLPSGGDWVATHLYYGECGDGRFVLTNPIWYAGRIGFVVDSQGVLP